MKHYLSTLLVEDHDTNREHYDYGLIVAKSLEQALMFNHMRASKFGGDEHRKSQYGYDFGYSVGRGYTVSVHAVKEISPSTFDEMSATLPVFGEVEEAKPETQEPAEVVKTLARRISDQLAKRGTKVSHSLLLHAVAASLGKTDWQVLVSQPKQQNRWPNGNWPTTALREADDLSFNDRVHAVWLAQGDVELAAKLLHVHPDGLMNSFKTAGEADLAFCGRSFDWQPEHSLAPTFMATEEGRKFEVRVSQKANGHHQLDGYVGNRHVLSVDNYFGPTLWKVGMSSTLVSNFQEAVTAVACCNAVIHKALQLSYKAGPEAAE